MNFTDKVVLRTGACKRRGRVLARAFADAGVEPSRSDAAFIASMKALEARSRQAARELNPHGIRVYAIDEAGDTIVRRVFALLAEKP
jgi:NAD(P)-dependent dehydrogenase (short-subunit alcohol dehydrogenase family)